MKSFCKFFLIIALFFSSLLCAFAAEITEIQFTGLKKTKAKYLERVLKDFYGKEMTEETKSELESTLQQLQLFEEMEISVDEETGSVAVAVKEKMSFLPVPIVAASNGSFMAGAFVLDTNALGEQDAFMVGGLWSMTSLFAMGSFSVQAKDISHPGFSVSATVSRGESKIDNEIEERLFEYKRFGYSFGASIMEKFNKYLSMSAGCSASYFNADEKDDYGSIGVDRVRKITPNLSLALGRSDWNGVFVSQKSIGVSGALIFADYYDESTQTGKNVSAKAVFEQPIIDTLRIIVSLSGVYGWDEDITSYSGESAASVSILADNFSSARLGGGSAGLEWAFTQGKYATFSLYGLYEAAGFVNFDDEKKFNQGFEAGMKTYLKKIAFPALSFGVSYNATEQFWGYSFSFGAKF